MCFFNSPTMQSSMTTRPWAHVSVPNRAGLPSNLGIEWPAAFDADWDRIAFNPHAERFAHHQFMRLQHPADHRELLGKHFSGCAANRIFTQRRSALWKMDAPLRYRILDQDF